MLTRVVIALCFVSTVLPPLSTTDALACGRVTKEVVESAWKAAQVRNIGAIDEALPKATLSANDLIKVNELRAQAARLSEAGKLEDADRVLREAWKVLGHPERFVGQPVFPAC
jgi:hypothetical protein